MSYPLLQVTDMVYERDGRLLFSNLSFNLNSSEILLIEGNNGSGKTTLLRIIVGLIRPLHGDITWKQISISKERLAYHADLHYIGHQNGIKQNLSVFENLKLFCHYHDAKNISSIASVLEILSLCQFKNTLVQYLSAGQQRRVALAKLWLLEKKLWLLDEPFVGLDKQTQLLLSNHLKQHLQSGGLVLLTSHQLFNLEHEQKKILRLVS